MAISIFILRVSWRLLISYRGETFLNDFLFFCEPLAKPRVEKKARAIKAGFPGTRQIVKTREICYGPEKNWTPD
jgi:hypothetical protein